MSWRTLAEYPLKSPFYPEILPFQKYAICRRVVQSTLVSASQNVVITGTIANIPANATILFYQILMFNEEIYTPSQLRVGACDLINGDTQFQYTLHTDASIVGSHRAYINFCILYENNAEI